MFLSDAALNVAPQHSGTSDALGRVVRVTCLSGGFVEGSWKFRFFFPAQKTVFKFCTLSYCCGAGGCARFLRVSSQK